MNSTNSQQDQNGASASHSLVVSQIIDSGTVAVLLSDDFLKVTIPLCFLPPEIAVGDRVSLATRVEDNGEHQTQMKSMQHSLIQSSRDLRALDGRSVSDWLPKYTKHKEVSE
eukprot:m.117670 g.117670  ORF g.117670 m.117670 type:complete len:112 (-) comp14256_c0_seq1:1719-2054(-)